MNNETKHKEYLKESKFIENEDNDLSERIMCFLKKDHVTFIEINNIFGKGEYTLLMGVNVVLWHDMKKEVADCISELWESKKILYYPTEVITYLVDGGALSLPLVKGDCEYKTPHWTPVVIRRTDVAKGTIHSKVIKHYINGGWDV